ncbi:MULTISPECIES: hypothetical protein [Rhodomicrobium]|uniref:hypothetical protein n=1 Tax=Rhodomicrobium TaxID=1068 RepID=UPI001482488D|nr:MULTISPECIES: hypothetical protein [Rhodomicrobium]
MLNALLSKFSIKDATERYRPEQHYMRGPGPKAKAKANGRPDTDHTDAATLRQPQRTQTRRA